MRSALLARLLALAVATSLGTAATAQTPQRFSRIYGTSDLDVPTPVHSTKTVSDSTAIQRVIDFVKLSGVSGWKGLTAEGTIKYASGSEYPAHLAVLGMDHYRLDIDRAEGKQSTVVTGVTGMFLPAQGKPAATSSDINALGLIAFVRLLSSQYPNAKSIWTDQGLTTIGGKVLSRVTLDDPATDATGNPWKTEELFFDPGTGRLVMSTAVVHLNSSDPALYMLATSYDDYRTVNGITLPYSYTQSLNGQTSWALSLTTIDLQAIPTPALFNY